MTKRREAKAPKQARSRFLVDAILEATARVVREQGWSGAKVARIASVAGVSVGSLYRYFPGRDLILGALIDRALERDKNAFDAALNAMQGTSVQDSLESFLEMILADRETTDPELLRELVDVIEAAGRHQRVCSIFDAVCERFSDRLLMVHPELDQELVRRGSHMAFWGLRGALISRLRIEKPFDTAAFKRDVRWLLTEVIASACDHPREDPRQSKPDQDVRGNIDGDKDRKPK